MTDALNDHEGTVSIGGRNITNLRFADDIGGLAGREEELADLVERLDKTSTAFGMQINAEKTKLMTISTNRFSTDIRVNGEKLDCVNRFKYLEAIITDEGSKPEILARIAQATAALAKLKIIWNHRNIALTADTKRRIQAMEMRCLRKLLGISYRDHISNEEVRNRTRQAIGPQRPLDHSKKTQTEMVRAHNKIFRACQDNPAGHSARRAKKRQTEKEMGGKHPGMDGHDNGRRHEKH